MAHRMDAGTLKQRPSWSHGGAWRNCHGGWRSNSMVDESLWHGLWLWPQDLVTFRVWRFLFLLFVESKCETQWLSIIHACFRKVCHVKRDCHSAPLISLSLGATLLVMLVLLKLGLPFSHHVCPAVWSFNSLIVDKAFPNLKGFTGTWLTGNKWIWNDETFWQILPRWNFWWLVRWSLTFCWPSTGSNAGSKLIPMFSSLTSWKLFQHLWERSHGN